MTIAFFDLDKTLLACNSATLWVRAELSRGYLSHVDALWAGVWLLRYHLGDVDVQQVLERTIARLEGTQEAILRARTLAFYEAEISNRLRPGARQAIDAHRRRGDKLVILTSSSQYLSRAVAQDLAFDGVLSTILQVGGDGRFTGKSDVLCFGQNKRLLAESFAEEAGVNLKHCTFYTDSLADLPALQVVGRPVAVNPDPRLRRVATRAGWEVVDWGKSVTPRS